MASVWFLVCVLLAAQQVFARDCSDTNNIKSCDECIRCGLTWCNSNEKVRCSQPTDNFCPSGKEILKKYPTSPAIDLVDHSTEPVHYLRSVEVGDAQRTEFIYPGPEGTTLEPNIIFVNSTIAQLNSDSYTSYFSINSWKTYVKDRNGWSSMIKVMPMMEFCPETGTEDEFITLRLQAPSWNESYATATYHVPCACGCSSQVIPKSPECAGNGNFSCGICKCEKGWKGDFCKELDIAIPVHPTDWKTNFKPQMPTGCDRGDIGGCLALITNTVCSNNGNCTCDGKCECAKDIDGSQYFDDHCTDICTSSGYCDSCLRNPTNGPCDDCPTLIVEPLNRTIIDDTDDAGRKIWIACVEISEESNIEYVAMRDKKNFTHIMIIDNKTTGGLVGGAVNVTLPVILGVVALVAAAAAVAGYVFMKNRPPPMPLTDAGYQNIDAEECVGENPLYKPPTSFFNNPTYGKQ